MINRRRYRVSITSVLRRCMGNVGKMSKQTRFFEIIQIPRAARALMLARDMAQTLEVSPRTIYRDIVTLQSMQTPILGEPGIGYVMRKGYD